MAYPQIINGPKCFYRPTGTACFSYNPNGFFPPAVVIFGPFENFVTVAVPALWGGPQRAWVPFLAFRTGPGRARAAGAGFGRV